MLKFFKQFVTRKELQQALIEFKQGLTQPIPYTKYSSKEIWRMSGDEYYELVLKPLGIGKGWR